MFIFNNISIFNTYIKSNVAVETHESIYHDAKLGVQGAHKPINMYIYADVQHIC